MHSPCKYIPVRDDRVARKGDGEQRNGNNICMAGDHNDGRHTVLQAGLPIRHRHRRHHRQPLFVEAHHLHRNDAEQGGSAMVRRRHDLEHARDRHRRKSILRRASEHLYERDEILARAHLQHRRNGLGVERKGRVYRHQRPVGPVHRDPVHRPAPAHHLADLRAGSLSADDLQWIRIRHGLRHGKGMALAGLPRRRKLHRPRPRAEQVRHVVRVVRGRAANLAHRGRGHQPDRHRRP